MTSEQLEAARAERMRHNGLGALTIEDARTWMEETGLCLFLPRRQSTPALAPSFVEAIAGERNNTPNQKQIATAEELLVRLELDGVAVRLNLQGQPGEQPDYVVASWVLPYVYALRGDRDWRRTPQLTGSRQVSPLAIQAYKQLEKGDATVSDLKDVLGHGVSEVAVLRAITELWQQLRIIPTIAAPGKAAKWQLLRLRFQKAIAEGASTSQVTAISVLASIFLQAVIAASMEEVEVFLSPLTARSKIREVLRGLVATRQVHTLTLGHAPHFYVAGTLPEFSVVSTVYASATFGARFASGTYFGREEELEDRYEEPAHITAAAESSTDEDEAPARSNGHKSASNGSQNGKPSGNSNGSNGAARPFFNRKPAPAGGSRRPAEARSGKPSGSGPRSAKPAHAGSHSSTGSKPRPGTGSGLSSSRPARPGSSRVSASGKPGASSSVRKGGLSRPASASRSNDRKPAMAGGSSFRGGKPGAKKRG